MKFFRKLNLRDFRSKYRKVVNLVAIIVVFATTYALILPAITLESDKASQLSGISVSETNSETLNRETSEERCQSLQVRKLKRAL